MAAGPLRPASPRASINLPARRTTLLKQLKREGQQRAAQLSGTPCGTIRPRRDDESYVLKFYLCGGDTKDALWNQI